MRIVVFGLGYLGATHAACMAELGHEVLGVEPDPVKREKLTKGEAPFYEPRLGDLLQQSRENGRFVVTDSYAEAAAWGSVFFIAVGTPQRRGEFAADLTYVEAVIENLVPLLESQALLIGKSTVPVGTSHRLMEMCNDLAKPGVSVDVMWNPEFLREGHAVADTLEPDRIVVGIDSNHDCVLSIVRDIYSPILERGCPFLIMDTASAEMVKVAANSFLATKISFINAVAEICEAAGADVTAVADAIGYDDRIGRKFLNAGLGFGGGCLPKDIRAFMARAGELGASEALAFLREVDSVNMRRRNRVVDVVRRACGNNLLGKRIAVLGTAFKPESDDVRDSPALNVAGQLQLQGASLSVYDPRAMDNSRAEFPTLNYVGSAIEACRRADALVILTEWAEFVTLDPSQIGQAVSARVVIDGRHCLPKHHWETSGWKYYV